MAEASDGSRPSLMKIAAINVGLIFAILMVAEVIFGNWIFGPKYGFLNIPRNTVRQFDVTTLYRGGGIITYSRDKHGLRGAYDNVSKIDLLLLGGSTTNELYTDDSKTWRARMSDRFAQSGNPKTIINAGLEGQSTVGHIKNFEVWFPNIPGLKAKYILAYVGINDTAVTGQAISDYDEMRSPELSRRARQFMMNNSVFYDLFRKIRGWLAARRHAFIHGAFKKKENSQWKFVGKLENPPALQANSADIKTYPGRLRRLVREIREFGAVPILVTQTRGDAQRRDDGIYQLDYEDNESRAGEFLVVLEAYNAITLNVCREMKVVCVDLARELSFEKSDFYDHIHTSPAGSRKIGDYLFEKLKGIL